MGSVRKHFSRATLVWLANALFALLLVGVLIGTLEQFQQMLTTTGRLPWLLLGLIVVIGGAAIALRAPLARLVRAHRTVIVIGLAGLTILWQLMLVFALTGNTEWDPTILSFAAAGRPAWVTDYFSTCPNNYLLLVIERVLWKACNLVGIHNYAVFVAGLACLSYLLVDLTIWLVYRVGKATFSPAVGTVAALLLWLLVGITPFAVIPYSDIPALFLNALILLIESLLNKYDGWRRHALIFIEGGDNRPWLLPQANRVDCGHRPGNHPAALPTAATS